jgi:hypothetical protein
MNGGLERKPNNPVATMKIRTQILKTLAIASLVGSAAVVTSQAQVISWNYDYYGTFSGANDSAGVVSVPYWNDSYLQGFPAASGRTNLLDSTGATVAGFSFDTSTANGYPIQFADPGLDADGSNNKRLLNGYMNANNTQSISLNGIPYAQYDLYVYLSADVAGRAGTVSDGATTFSFATMGNTSISGANAAFAQTTDTTGANPLANYAVFSGLTAANQTITWNVPQYGGIAGYQIVAVPEPGAMGIAALSLGLLAVVRRSARRD